MAKMKGYAVEIEYVVRETIYVEARRPNGAAEKALTNEAYNAQHAYDCTEDSPCYGPRGLPKGAKVVTVRAV